MIMEFFMIPTINTFHFADKIIESKNYYFFSIKSTKLMKKKEWNNNLSKMQGRKDERNGESELNALYNKWKLSLRKLICTLKFLN